MSPGPQTATASSALPSLGPLEQKVQEILWRSDAPLSARQVMHLLPSGEGATPAYTTVATVLDHLQSKGLARRARLGRSWSYEPALTGCEYSARRMAQSLAETPDPVRCLARFVGMLTPEHHRTLTGLLDGSIAVPPPRARTGLDDLTG